MNRPAGFDKPRHGDAILCCRHITRKPVLFYIGDEHGIGMWVKTETAGNFWVRWISLCRWCNWWRRIRRQEPLAAAKFKAEWVEND
jgi:hypothetical protein